MSKSKKSAKKSAATATPTAKSKPVPEAAGPAPKPIVRAISQDLLDAAKALRKATGTSF